MSSYWEHRVANGTWSRYNDLERRTRALEEKYRQAADDIGGELFAIQKKLGREKVTLTEMHKYNRLTALQKKLQRIAKNLGHEVLRGGKKLILEGYRANYEAVCMALGRLKFDVPNQKLMEQLLEYPWSGKDFSARVWGNTAQLADQLNELLTRGLVQGKTLAEIGVQLDARMGRGFQAAHLLVRTEVMHYLNESSLAAYRDDGVERIQFWAALDERTCPDCGALHGKVYAIDKAPILPLHPQCRCTYLPVVAEEEDPPE